MGEDSYDQNSPIDDKALPRRLNTLPKIELYKIWLELNPQPKTATIDVRDYWRTPLHKNAVALDFSLFLSIIPFILAASTGISSIAVLPIAIIILSAFLIVRKLPHDDPYGVIGICSAFTDSLTNLRLNDKKKPKIPSINEVNLYRLPIMVRAAEKIINPALVDIQRALNDLERQSDDTAFSRKQLIELESKIRAQIKRSDDDWRAILQPKLEKVIHLIKEDNSQLAMINRVRNDLVSRRTKLESELQEMRERKEIIEQMEQIEELQAEDAQSDAAFQQMMHNLLTTVNDTQSGLNEARNIATAHERAKVEIAQLLEQ